MASEATLEEAPPPAATSSTLEPPPPMSFEVASSLTKAGLFEKAIEGWQELLEAAVKEDEMATEAGILYLKYGDALLRKAEESGELFDQEDDDVVVAFEVLEVARLIFEREKNESSSSSLADVMARLGDLQKLNGNFGEAIKDYERCLALRMDLDVSDRRVADAHWCLAVAHEYARAAADSTSESKGEALAHYKACAASLAKRAESLAEDDPERKDLESILTELEETIDASQDNAKGLQALQVTKQESTTVTGFGNKQQKKENDQPSPVVTTLQPKRKAPPPALPPTDEEPPKKKK